MKLSNDTQIISPDQKQVRQVIIDLLSKYVKRGEVIQDIVLQSGAGDERFERQSSAMHVTLCLLLQNSDLILSLSLSFSSC